MLHVFTNSACLPDGQTVTSTETLGIPSGPEVVRLGASDRVVNENYKTKFRVPVANQVQVPPA